MKGKVLVSANEVSNVSGIQTWLEIWAEDTQKAIAKLDILRDRDSYPGDIFKHIANKNYIDISQFDNELVKWLKGNNYHIDKLEEVYGCIELLVRELPNTIKHIIKHFNILYFQLRNAKNNKKYYDNKLTLKYRIEDIINKLIVIIKICIYYKIDVYKCQSILLNIMSRLSVNEKNDLFLAVYYDYNNLKWKQPETDNWLETYIDYFKENILPTKNEYGFDIKYYIFKRTIRVYFNPGYMLSKFSLMEEDNFDKAEIRVKHFLCDRGLYIVI